MTLHEMLVEIKRKVEAGEDKDSICFQLSDEAVKYSSNFCRNMRAELETLTEKWPMRSGDPSYPVPVPDPHEGADLARTAFWHHKRAGALWKGQYGALRRQLLDWLIKETMP